ncbi:hypothetical protein ACFY36_04345 [Actinoplanes sp. NPDC000266]
MPLVLSAVAVLLVLCVGGGTAAVALLLRNQDAEPITTETVPGPTTEPAPAPTKTVKIVKPRTLGGRSQVRDADLQATADLLRTRIADSADPNFISGVYGKPGTKNTVLMAATTSSIAFPQRHVASTLSSFGNSTVGVSGITNAATGSLGGDATCGNTLVEGQKAAVCAWADEGSIGLIVFYAKTASAAAGEFPQLRAEIEKKA